MIKLVPVNGVNYTSQTTRFRSNGTAKRRKKLKAVVDDLNKPENGLVVFLKHVGQAMYLQSYIGTFPAMTSSQVVQDNLNIPHWLLTKKQKASLLGGLIPLNKL